MNETDGKKEIRLSDYLSADRILFFKGKQNKADVLNDMIDLLAERTDLDSREDLARGIFHRETLMSTGIGSNLAIPHFRLPLEDTDAYLALGICPDGIVDYFSPDSQPVRLVFMIVAAKQHKLIHVKILSAISNLFREDRLKVALLAASDPEMCVQILKRAEN